MSLPIISCVILNYNDADRTISLLEKIESYKIIKYVVIVDNLSTDNSYAILNEYTKKISKAVLILSKTNGGYGCGNNIGAYYAINKLKSDYIIIANPDVIFSERVINEQLEAFKNDKTCGVASCIQLNADGEPCKNSAERIVSRIRFAFEGETLLYRLLGDRYYSLEYLKKERFTRVDCVAGAYLMLSAKAFMDISGYDENMFLYYEEVALGVRMKNKGYSTYLCSCEGYKHLHDYGKDQDVEKKLKTRRISTKSHRYVAKTYLKGSALSYAFDLMITTIGMIESTVKRTIVKGIRIA